MFGKIFALSLLFCATLFAQDMIKDSIVKIYTVSKTPSYSSPWNVSTRRSHGSGSIISGNRILTNAHVVANETFVEVKRFGQTKRYEAEVEFISHQADLALLKVKEKEFFQGSKPLQLGNLPKIQQKIVVYGFPMGGNSLSVSTGIVSRIEHNRYAHSRESFLAIQIDAAVNPGSSGGPAMSNGKIVGVVMQQITRSQNIGYLVPTTIIKHFLKDVEDGKYDGFGNLGIDIQRMQNQALREVYKMDKNTTGIRVVDIAQVSNLSKLLQKDDILLSIDGHPIQNDATVEFMPQQYTLFMYYVEQKQLGDSVEMKILRDGKKMLVSIPIVHIADDDLLVNTLEHDVMPRYYIYGGYVFSPLSKNLLVVSGRKSSLDVKKSLLEWATPQKDEVVVLLRVLADKSNRGDHGISMWQIDTINGKKFQDFKEFLKILQGYKGKYIILRNARGIEIAIDTKKAQKAQQKILKRYSIRSASDAN